MKLPEETPRARCVHYKKEHSDVFIGRGSIWGNPYVIGRDGTRSQVIAKYKARLLRTQWLLDRLPELRDKALGCTCKPLACHGDPLAEIVNSLPEDPV